MEEVKVSFYVVLHNGVVPTYWGEMDQLPEITRIARLWPETSAILLRFFASRGLGHVGDDLTQQVGLRMLIQETRIGSDEQFRAYALTVARWLVVDHWRADSRVTHVGTAELEEMPSGSPAPEERLEARQQLERVLQSMPPREQQVFEQVVLQGVTDEEAGRVLGIAPGTVRSVLRLVRRRILNLVD